MREVSRGSYGTDRGRTGVNGTPERVGEFKIVTVDGLQDTTRPSIGALAGIHPRTRVDAGVGAPHGARRGLTPAPVAEQIKALFAKGGRIAVEASRAIHQSLRTANSMPKVAHQHAPPHPPRVSRTGYERERVAPWD